MGNLFVHLLTLVPPMIPKLSNGNFNVVLKAKTDDMPTRKPKIQEEFEDTASQVDLHVGGFSGNDGVSVKFLN